MPTPAEYAARHGVLALLLPALLLAGCDMIWPPLPDDPYFRVKVEAVFDGEPVRIEGVTRCELSKIYRGGLGSGPASVVARLQPGLIGTRLKKGAPGALFVITPRVCQHILKQDKLPEEEKTTRLPEPAEGFIPLLAWFEDPGESHRLQLFLYDAYHPGTESRIEFVSFSLAEATHDEYKAWLEDYTSGPNAMPLDPIAEYEMKNFPDKPRVGAPGGGFGCKYGLRVPPKVWRKDPVIVDWVESQSGDGRYWAIPRATVENPVGDENDPGRHLRDVGDGYFRDSEGKWLGQGPLIYLIGTMLDVTGSVRYAYVEATLRRTTLPIIEDIWDFYMPYRYTADGAALLPETVGILECQATSYERYKLQARQGSRIEGLRPGDWEVAGGFYYDRRTDEFITIWTTGLSYATAY